MAWREPMLRGLGVLVDHKAMYEQTRQLLNELEIDIDPKIKVKELSVAKMQMIEIAKAISTTRMLS
jgi:ABC-type sugar transport system ATPase subunit